MKTKALSLLLCLFSLSCNNLTRHHWKLIGIENATKMQFHTDSIYYVFCMDTASVEDVRAGRRARVKHKTEFSRSGPVKIEQLALVLSFERPKYSIIPTDQNNIFSTDDKCNTSEGTYKMHGDSICFDYCSSTLFDCINPKPIPVPDMFHKKTRSMYFNATTHYSFHGKDTLYLHNKFDNALIFVSQ